MKIPLEKRLRKRMHVEIGYLQDEVVEVLYSFMDDLVLHGGTAVWRCYGGNRFSENLGFYGRFEKEIIKNRLEARGLKVSKIKTTENLLFAKISNGNAEIRVEINKKLINKRVIAAYERMDGSFIDIYALGVDDLVREKMEAYNSRRFIRDLYDIYHLVRSFDISPDVKKEVRDFAEKVVLPVDESIIKSIVYSSVPPTFRTMVSYLRLIK